MMSYLVAHPGNDYCIDALKATVTSASFRPGPSPIFSGKTAYDICMQNLRGADIFTDIMKCLLQNDVTDPDMLIKLFTGLRKLPLNNPDKCELMSYVVQKEAFPITEKMDGSTAGHLAAKLEEFGLIEVIVMHPNCDLNAQDAMGNTMLFYICEYCDPTNTVTLITNKDISWNFDQKNVVGQTVYDYYMGQPKTNPAVKKILAEKCGYELSGVNIPGNIEPCILI